MTGNQTTNAGAHYVIISVTQQVFSCEDAAQQVLMYVRVCVCVSEFQSEIQRNAHRQNQYKTVQDKYKTVQDSTKQYKTVQDSTRHYKKGNTI